MNVAVFGASGFTGRYVCERLSKASGIRLTRLDSSNADLRSKRSTERIIGELEPDVVVNLAGISFVNSNDIKLLYETNAFGQLNLLQALSDSGFDGKLVFSSSGNIYGNMTTRRIGEGTCPQPVNHYSFSKVLAENFCSLFSTKFQIIITRPFSCIGVGQAPNFLLPKIVSHFRAKKPEIELGNLDVERDFVDIRDIASMYEIVIMNDTKFDVFNFSNDDTHSIREILNIFSQFSGYEMHILTNPNLIRPNDLHYQRGANERIKSVGYSREYTFEDTLKWLYFE